MASTASSRVRSRSSRGLLRHVHGAEVGARKIALAEKVGLIDDHGCRSATRGIERYFGYRHQVALSLDNDVVYPGTLEVGHLRNAGNVRVVRPKITDESVGLVHGDNRIRYGF